MQKVQQTKEMYVNKRNDTVSQNRLFCRARTAYSEPRLLPPRPRYNAVDTPRIKTIFQEYPSPKPVFRGHFSNLTPNAPCVERSVTVLLSLPIPVVGLFHSISDSSYQISSFALCWFPKMAPQTRNQFPKVVIERDSDSEPSSSDEEEDEEEEDEEEEEVVKSENGERKEEALDDKKKGKAPITISLKKVCKVKAFTFPGAHIRVLIPRVCVLCS